MPSHSNPAPSIAQAALVHLPSAANGIVSVPKITANDKNASTIKRIFSFLDLHNSIAAIA